MPETLQDLLMSQPPTPERPLLGVLVLVVEDSRFACDALRLVCQRSGARIRRAESLASATRHLRAYRPRVAIVDLGLPDGSGLTLISRLARAEPRIEVIIATSGDDTQVAAAMEAGADIFLPKPLSSVSAFQSMLLGLLPSGFHPLRLPIPAHDNVDPDPIAFKDDLSLAFDLLSGNPDARTLEYVANFLKGLGRSVGDASLGEFGDMLAALKAGQPETGTPRTVAARLKERIGVLSVV
jgi:CheY-like chemotaxis protein